MKILPPSDLPADLSAHIAAFKRENANLETLPGVLDAIAFAQRLQRRPMWSHPLCPPYLPAIERDRRGK